jgi:hypothetical protein
MATAALALSIFTFIPPCGIAAIVLGHISRQRILASHGTLDGAASARAALIIAYTQAALLTVAGLMLWQVLHLTFEDFRRDAMVQRVLRTSDNNQVPDYETAGEEEMTARALLVQIAGIEAEYYHKSERGYLCSMADLMEAGGTEGSTPAEKRAFALRLRQSRYNFEIQACIADASKGVTPQYRLTAVPRWPQSPGTNGQWCADEKGAFTRLCSPIFCADETGAVKQIYRGTSADCFDHGNASPAP